MSDILQQIAIKLYGGEDKEVVELVQKALDQGMDVKDVMQSGLISGMDEVGKDFKAGDLFVPEVLIAARAMKAGMEILQPLLAEEDTTSVYKCVLGTVKGDLHDIGKNLVGMMMEGAGFEVIDLGIDADTETFLAAVKEHQPAIVGMSALLTTTMVNMKATIDALEEAGLRDSVNVMVGGAPVTEAFAKEIGADTYAPDAASAADMARKLTDRTSVSA